MVIADLPCLDLYRPMFLLGMPRSGTTWLSQIFEAHPQAMVRFSPNYSFTFKNLLTSDSSLKQWMKVLEGCVTTEDSFVTHEYRRQTGDLPRFSKEPSEVALLCVKDTRFHELYVSALELLPRAQIIYIVRDPCATLFSWWKCKEFPRGADFMTGWRDGAGRKKEGPGEYWGFDDWKSLTALYDDLSSRRPAHVHVVRYEELVAKPHQVAARMLAFAGLSLHSRVAQFLDESQQSTKESPYSVFKRPEHTERWRRDFPLSIQETILREIDGTRLSSYLSIPLESNNS